MGEYSLLQLESVVDVDRCSVLVQFMLQPFQILVSVFSLVIADIWEMMPELT